MRQRKTRPADVCARGITRVGRGAVERRVLEALCALLRRPQVACHVALPALHCRGDGSLGKALQKKTQVSNHQKIMEVRGPTPICRYFCAAASASASLALARARARALSRAPLRLTARLAQCQNQHDADEDAKKKMQYDSVIENNVGRACLTLACPARLDRVSAE